MAGWQADDGPQGSSCARAQEQAEARCQLDDFGDRSSAQLLTVVLRGAENIRVVAFWAPAGFAADHLLTLCATSEQGAWQSHSWDGSGHRRVSPAFLLVCAACTSEYDN